MNLSRLARRKEQRRAQERRRTTWMLVLATVVILAVALISLWPRLTYVPEVSGRPNIVVDQALLDFGTQHWDTSVTAVFTIQNTGDQELRILNDPQVRVVTGCCPPQVQMSNKSLQPGQKVTLSMTFMMHEGMDGPHEFRVLVETNDPSHPQQELTVLSNWVQ